jgi:hypothetical protein
MEKIELTLKNVKLRSYHRISWILAFINIITQLFITFRSQYEQYKTFIIALLSATLLFLALAQQNKFISLRRKEYTLIIYLVISGIWLKLGLYWPIALNAFFYALYIYSIRKFEVVFMQDKIIYPSFPEKEILWSELQNIIAKDGILTIDFRNNRILQNEIEDDDYFDEKQFNDFCREQLKK